MKIIAVTNIKGGVGKTTTAVNLSYLCAASGRATLLWDLDPQGAATYTLRGEPLERASPKKLLAGKRHLPELILSTGYPGLDLLPADFSYRHFDVHLSERKRPTERLLKMSRSLRDVYAVLFLDCAPGISLLSENVLRAADAIVEEEIRAAGLYEAIWQSFGVLLPVRSGGVMGDARTYEETLAVRAVHSRDGMTADFVHLPYEVLARISSRVINEVRGINRVVYDITSKPPGTIEWE